MMFGRIFNIQKFSIHDGEGLRTTVFFKGCPLKCKWCSNPESQLSDIEISFDDRKCIKCLTCVNICPNKAISNIKEKIIINKEKCDSCMTCIKNCVNKALSCDGENKSVEEVVKICLQDIEFYKESGGGVTFSGGECFLQKEFTKELLFALKKHKINVVAETTGYVKEEDFQELARMFDMLLYDIKHYDTNKHKEFTGVNNSLILKNLKWAKDNNINILPRIPVIPGFNDSLKDAEGLSNLLILMSFKKVQLLPFHQFGERKYELLNRDYSYKNIKALNKDDLKDYQKIFIKKGLDCFF